MRKPFRVLLLCVGVFVGVLLVLRVEDLQVLFDNTRFSYSETDMPHAGVYVGFQSCDPNRNANAPYLCRYVLINRGNQPLTDIRLFVAVEYNNRDSYHENQADVAHPGPLAPGDTLVLRAPAYHSGVFVKQVRVKLLARDARGTPLAQRDVFRPSERFVRPG